MKRTTGYFNVAVFFDRDLPYKNNFFLIGSPFLMDYFFERAVVYVPLHDEQGSMGFILNRKMKGVSLPAVIHELPEEINIPVYVGGPVSMNSLFWIHTLPDIPDAIKIGDGIYMGGKSSEIIKAVKEGILTKDNLKCFLGYSGWGKNQLLRELKEGSWVVIPASKDIIFKDGDKIDWRDLTWIKGGLTRLLSQIPDNIHYN